MSSLKDRLSKVAGKSGVNLNPEDVAPPPVKEVEKIPDMREVIVDAKERLKLMRLIEAHVAFGIQEKEAKKARAPLTIQIKDILGRNNASKLMVDGNRINYFNSPRSTIKGDLLLAHGITPKVIAECTVTSDAYTLKITPPGEGDDE